MMPIRRATRVHVAAAMAASSRQHGRLFSLSCAPLPDSGGIHVACSVSKKVARLATTRNTLKRRARAAARKAIDARAPASVFFFQAKPAAARADFGAIATDIGELVERAIAHCARK